MWVCRKPFPAAAAANVENEGRIMTTQAPRLQSEVLDDGQRLERGDQSALSLLGLALLMKKVVRDIKMGFGPTCDCHMHKLHPT